MENHNAKDLLDWLDGDGLDDAVTEEEAFEELVAEGVDFDALVAAARSALRRIRRKLRVMGVPVDQVDAFNEEGAES